METTQFTKKVTSISKKAIYVMSFGLLVLLMPSCTKDNGKDKAHLSIQMTDAPGDYSAVMVDVQGVEIKGTDLFQTFRICQ